MPFKDTQCADCVNSSLLVDALIVTKIRGIKRQNTDNVLNSFCPLVENDKSPSAQNNQGISRRYNGMKRIQKKAKLLQITIVIVFLEIAKKCGVINTLQESIIKQNPEVNWTKQVMWHQWQYILVDTGEKMARKNK